MDEKHQVAGAEVFRRFNKSVPILSRTVYVGKSLFTGDVYRRMHNLDKEVRIPSCPEADSRN